MANGDVVFFGTAAVGLPIAKELSKSFRLRLVVTQPDRRGGRNRQLLVPAVKQFAMENRLALLQPPDLREPELELALRRIAPDAAVVVAYGQFIPRDIRDLPRFRSLNVHFSLLPAYRGAAPVQRAIQNGGSRSGIPIFQRSGRMDAGPGDVRQDLCYDAALVDPAFRCRRLDHRVFAADVVCGDRDSYGIADFLYHIEV